MANIGGLTPIGKHIKEFPRTEALFEDVSNDDVAQVIRMWQLNPVAAAIDIFGFKYGLPGHQSLALKLAWSVGDCIQVWSRGAGKSRTYNTDSIILTREFGYVDLPTIFPNLDFTRDEHWIDLEQPIHMWNGEGWQQIDKILVQPQKRTKTVRTRMGYELTGSDVHLVQGLEDGEVVWKSFSNIRSGDRVLIGRNQDATWGDHEADLDECYLIGLLLGDGTINSSLYFTSADQQLLKFVGQYDCSKPKPDKRTTGTYTVRFSNEFYTYLRGKYGISHTLSYDKAIPQSILTSKQALRACLQGLFDTDGGCDEKGVSFCTTSKRLAQQVHLALSLFGIISKLREKKTKSKFGKAYIIEIRGIEACKFGERIGFRLSRKQNQLEQWCKERSYNSNIDTIPGASDILIRLKSRYRFPLDGSNELWRKYRGGIRNRKSLTACSLQFFMSLLPVAAKNDDDYKKLEQLLDLNQNYFFDEVECVEDGIDNCVDFNVPTGEKYWSNGFINHNTFFLSMFAWISAVLFPEEKIGIFGPSFRQSKFVWAEVERAYDKSPVLRELCVKRPIITPDKCHTKLYNGSLIEALPLGDGSKIRGARYYRILGDEAAQIPEDILDVVIQGMRATTKDPMEAVMAMKLQRQMVEDGSMTEEEATFKPERNKMLLTSTAFYQFNHLYRRVELYRREITDPANKDLNPVIKVPDYVMWNRDRALVMFDYQDPPEGFMNIESIMEAKRKMSELKWKMEYCFAPGTEVIVPTGLKNIEDIRVGDHVLTHNGRFMPVKQTGNRYVDEEVVEYTQFGYNRPVIVTKEHPYLYGNQWVAVSDVEHFEKANLRKLSGLSHIYLSDYADNYSIIDHEDEQYIYATASQTKTGKYVRKKPHKGCLPLKINLDFNFGLIVGWYAAEGSIGANGKACSFALDSHTDGNLDDYINELGGAIKNVFGLDPKIYRRENTANVTINRRIVVDLMKSLCPGISDTKYILPDVLYSNEEFMKGFLVGYWHGDGCINSKPQAIAACVNKNLLAQISVVLSYFAFATSLRDDKPERVISIKGKDCSCSPTYVLEIKGRDALRFDNFINNRCHAIEKSIYANDNITNDGTVSRFNIREKRLRHYTGVVYNLEVESDHSYSLVGATNHNCAYFPPDSEGFFRMSKIEASRAHKRFTIEPKGKPQFNYVMGVDVARNSDNFAIAIGRVMDDKIELVNVITLNSREFPVMHDKIRECIDKYKIIYICMDAGGGGTSLEDLLHDERMCPKHQKLIWDSITHEEFEGKEGWHILEMIKFSDDSIPKMAYQLQADIDHGRFLFPSAPSAIADIADQGFDNDGNSLDTLESMYDEIEQCIEETTSIVAQSTRTGKVHLGLPGEISKTHASEGAALLKPPRKDRWTAIMLMNWAAHRKLRQIETKKEEEPELAPGMSMFTGMVYGAGLPTHVALRMAQRAKRS